MSQKRMPEDGKTGSSDGEPPDEKRQKVPALRGVVLEAMKMNAVQKLLLAMEPLLRTVVKEEVELALKRHLNSITRQCGNQVYPSTSRSLQLHFKTKLSLPIFTGTRIEGEDCCAMTVALVDALTGQVVKSGPESTAKVEIVVLEGDFEGGEEDNWTLEEFKSNIVREREGKRSLLTGDIFLDLNEGTGVVGELSFTDNSSWTRSRKFRLGARVADGYCDGIRVIEAKSEPFIVKDHRGELYKKHYPPLLHDEVWRLEKIGKDGAFHKRLSCHNINTVKDFLFLLCADASRLRNILGSGMSVRMWEVTVEHARTCILTDQVHVYSPNGQRKTGVVFNDVGEILGVVSEQQFLSVNDLPDNEKAAAHTIAKLAYAHWDDVITCDKGVIFGSHSSAAPNSFPLGSQSLTDYVNSSFPSPVKNDGFGFSHSSIMSPDIFYVGAMKDSYALQQVGSTEPSFDRHYQSVTCRDAFRGSGDLEKYSSAHINDECGSQRFFGEDSLLYPDSSMSLLSQSLGADSPTDLGTALSGFLNIQERQPEAAAHGRARRGWRWRTLSYAFGWAFFIKKIVASKKINA